MCHWRKTGGNGGRSLGRPSYTRERASNQGSLTRRPVRLGRHGDEYIFNVARGLHDSVMGFALLGTGPDPEIMFEEHGTGTICRYIEAHDDAGDVLLVIGLAWTEKRPGQERCAALPIKEAPKPHLP